MRSSYAGLLLFSILFASSAAGQEWKRHEVASGYHCNTAVAADFTGDGKRDIIASGGGKQRLFVAPDWKEVVLESNSGINCIHSEVLDVNGDGRPDFVGAQYSPGHIFWLECPAEPLAGNWKLHTLDTEVNGIHGLLVGDVDGDGRPDLLANSAQPKNRFPNSLVWYRASDKWSRHVLADGNAPGLSHYLGLGDVDGDGRADAASGAKGGPMAEPGTGNWFAWWQAPADPTKVWTRHLISDQEEGATNIHPVDVNGDGKTDFLASRGHGRGVIWFEAPNRKRHDIDAEIEGPHCLVVTDLDGDGDADAATCAKDSKLCIWYENDGHGKFTRHVVGRDQAAYDIRAADLDGDGDLDLLVAGQASNNVVWFANPRK